MRNTRTTFLSIIAVILLLFGGTIQAFAADEKNAGIEPEGLKIKVENGYGGEYKIGYYCPFTITIENGYKDFSGEIQLIVPNDYSTDNMYSLKADIAKGSNETFRMDVPIFGYITRLKLVLAEGNTKVFEKSINIKPGFNTEMVTLGILSDKPETVGYFNTVYDLNGTAMPMKIIKLTEQNFPDSELALRGFNGIVINDFDTSRLNGKQYEALKNSVEAGTGLLLGTGGYHEKTFKLFTDDFIPGTVGETKEIDTAGLSRIGKTKQNFSLTLDYADISIEGAEAIDPMDGVTLLQEKTFGKGKILIAGFDLGEEEILNWGERASFSNEVLKRLFYTRINSMQGGGVIGLSTPYYLENFLNNIPELPRPNFLLIMGILALYILLVAPVSYFFLKKFDRRELMWFVSPALGIIFAVVLYFAGTGTRLSGPLVNYINVIEGDIHGKGTMSTYGSLSSPNRGDLLVETEKNEKIIPMLYTNYDSNMENNGNRKIAAKVMLGTKPAIEYRENGVWSSRVISIGGSKRLEKGITSRVNRAAGDFQGEIKNETDLDFEVCYIMFKNSYLEIRDLKKGETRGIHEKQVKTYTDYWQMFNDMFKDPYSIKKSAALMTTEELLKIRTDFQRRQIIEGYNQMMMVQDKSRIFAFAKSTTAPTILVNGKKPNSFEKTVLIGQGEVSYISGKDVFIPAGVLVPKLKPVAVSTGVNLNPDAGFLYGSNADAEVYYEIDKTVLVTELKLTATGGNLGGGGYPGKPISAVASPSGTFKEYIWNYTSEKWEERDGKEKVYGPAECKNYMGSDNVLRLKYEALNGEIQLPQISVKGTVK